MKERVESERERRERETKKNSQKLDMFRKNTHFVGGARISGKVLTLAPKA